MRQLITRIDDDLHRRLRERAAEEGTSMNALVTSALEDLIAQDDAGARLARRLAASGVGTVEFPPPEAGFDWERAILANRGSGAAILEALVEMRRGE